MNNSWKTVVLLCVAQAAWADLSGVAIGSPIIVDHTCTNIRRVPTNWIAQAKQKLHIVYGHTSHGSQLPYGMSALTSFMTTQGYPSDLFAWNNEGTNGALHLRDAPAWNADDLGSPSRTAWASATRDYLLLHPECNVVIWSWCGQVSDSTQEDIELYLNLMDGLQREYTNVLFVHMTGHLDGQSAAGNLNIRNNQIRQHCLSHGEILYDFADIESYDPDGLINYMERRGLDECWYDSDGDNIRDRNWALDWQNTHVQGVDWFDCFAAHSYPLVGNLKAYAAWWLWARLAGWTGPSYTFAQWQLDQFTDEERSKPDLETSLWGRWADPDADALPNIFEYALGQKPREFTQGGAFLEVKPNAKSSYPLLSYYRAPNTEGVSFNLQFSEDLVLWSNVLANAISNQVSAADNGSERVDIQLLEEAPRPFGFYRLRLEAE